MNAINHNTIETSTDCAKPIETKDYVVNGSFAGAATVKGSDNDTR
jgi:hypothetical protein